MENSESNQTQVKDEEQGQVSTQAEPESEETKAEVVANVLDEVYSFDSATKLEILERALKVAKTPKEIAGRRDPGEHPVEPIVREWFLALPYKARLAVSLYSNYLNGDHYTDWIEDVRRQFNDDVLAEFDKEDSDLPDTEKFMTGLCCETFVWSQHL